MRYVSGRSTDESGRIRAAAMKGECPAKKGTGTGDAVAKLDEAIAGSASCILAHAEDRLCLLAVDAYGLEVGIVP